MQIINNDDICAKKAIELGEMIMSSEASIRLADAKAAFEANAQAAKAHNDYMLHTKTLQTAKESGLIDRKHYSQLLAKLIEMEINLKNIPAVQEYYKAEEDYNNYATTIVDILKSAIGMENAHARGCGGCGCSRPLA